MSLLEINRNDIIWSMGPMDHMYQPGTHGTYLILLLELIIIQLGWTIYMYMASFIKLAASEVKLRFRLSLCV